MKGINEKIINTIISFQKNEATEHLIYKKLSTLVRNRKNRDILSKISKDELRHYNIWKKYSGKEVKPGIFKYLFYVALSMIAGVTFGMKLMESGEEGAQVAYDRISKAIPDAQRIRKDETGHEKYLIGMIDEEKLKYFGSMILGLNDALVELTGTLAGLTFALQNTRIVALAGLITGIAAALSMAASEYLSTKTEGGDKDPIKASFYTGIVYVGAVVLLIAPYFIFSSIYAALSSTLLVVVCLIFIFTYYLSVVRGIDFWKRFSEMLAISLGVAVLSFAIGIAVRIFLGVNI